MKPDPSEQSIFAEALTLEDSQQRVAYLDQACLGHPTLRARVENLLRATERAGRFLEDGPTTPGLDTLPLGDSTGTPGERIGRYKLLDSPPLHSCFFRVYSWFQSPRWDEVPPSRRRPGEDTRHPPRTCGPAKASPYRSYHLPFLSKKLASFLDH